jgi:hypothetical protein
MRANMAERKRWGSSRWLGLSLVAVAFCQLSTPVCAAEIIFLQDGRTIQADKTEVIGDSLRIQKPTEIIYVPRTDVLSIHEVSPPTPPPSGTPPAEVYRDTTQQMNEKVRRDTQQLLIPPRVHRP